LRQRIGGRGFETRHLHQIAKVKSLFLQAFFVSGLHNIPEVSKKCRNRLYGSDADQLYNSFNAEMELS